MANYKKITAAALAVLMVSGLAACGNSSEVPEETTTHATVPINTAELS